jgi:hypothetical protein
VSMSVSVRGCVCAYNCVNVRTYGACVCVCVCVCVSVYGHAAAILSVRDCTPFYSMVVLRTYYMKTIH